MKKNFYLQHPLMAMQDPRMQNLVEKEKLRGVGAYWFIIEKLGMLPEQRATFEYLQPYCKSRKIPFAYLKKIILEYELFTLEEDGHFVPAELNPSQKKRDKMIEKVAEGDVSKCRKNKNQPSLLNEEVEKAAKKLSKPLNNGNLSKMNNNIYKENIKDIIATSTEEKKETADVATVSSNVQDAGGRPPVNPDGNLQNHYDKYGHQLPPLQPIRPWQEMVNELSQESTWLEVACMKSGYAMLLKRCLSKAIETFRHHIEAYDKGEYLLKMSDVHTYFINFVAAGSRTSKELHNILLEYDAHTNPTLSATDNPYRHEQLIDGKRTYLGCPIPDDAPPRPDENAIWNEEIRTWMSGKTVRTQRS